MDLPLPSLPNSPLLFRPTPPHLLRVYFGSRRPVTTAATLTVFMSFPSCWGPCTCKSWPGVLRILSLSLPILCVSSPHLTLYYSPDYSILESYLSCLWALILISYILSILPIPSLGTYHPSFPSLPITFLSSPHVSSEFYSVLSFVQSIPESTTHILLQSLLILCCCKNKVCLSIP